jgi:hypothetical protein
MNPPFRRSIFNTSMVTTKTYNPKNPSKVHTLISIPLWIQLKLVEEVYTNN